MMKRSRPNISPRTGLAASLFAGILATYPAAPLAAQNSTFSSSPDYQAMLAELARKVVRPSRLSAGNLLTEPPQPVPVVRKETAADFTLETNLWRINIGKNPWELELTNKSTRTVWRLAVAGRAVASNYWSLAFTEEHVLKDVPLRSVEQVEKVNQGWKLRGIAEGLPERLTQAVDLEIAILSPNIIRLSIDGSKIAAQARLGFNFVAPGPFFGLGERFGKAKLDGLETTLRPEDRLGQPGHNWTYVPVPFLLSPRGLGVYFDTAWPSTFNLTESDRQRFSVQLGGPSADSYLFIGRDPKEVIESYTALTGRTPLSPPWAFGVWINSYQGPDAVLSDARRLRQEHIPASAIWVFDVMDPATNMGWPYWRTGFYPNPRELTDELHRLGFKVLTYFFPFVRSLLNPYRLPNPTYEEGVRHGYFVLKPSRQPAGWSFDSSPVANIDFTNSGAADWWEKMVRGILTDHNFDGWMEDFGEWTNDDDHFTLGKTGWEMANIYPLLYHRITYQIARRVKPDVVEFVRSGYAGSQGFTPVVWGGDQFPIWTSDYGLPSVVPAGITAGLSGFAVWGPDIDSNGASKELWTRWVEFGALTPIMRDHLWDRPKNAVDLWFDRDTMEIFRKYARLHISLFPYLYSYAHQAVKNGLPIIRHLMLEWPEDANTYDAENEYLLGEKILVAPVVTEGARARSFYLPKGSWVDYWTGETLEGGKTVSVPAPLDRIPVMVRAGSAIPLADPDLETLAQDLPGRQYRALGHRLGVRVFPSSATSRDQFTMYDGTRISSIHEQPEVRVSVENSPSPRQYEVVLPMAGAPREVTLSGRRLNELDEPGYRARDEGWWLDRASQAVRVVFTGGDFALQVRRP